MTNRPNIPSELKRQVLMEAGHRCAIPSCRAYPIEIAHIVPFSRVKEHKFDNLIALCPNCHTRYDKGEIDRISMIKYKENLKNIHLNFVNDSNIGFDITLWCEYKNDSIILYVENDSDQPLLDFVLYADAVFRPDIEIYGSPHTLEIVFGTIPKNKTLSDTYDISLFNSRGFGFPFLSGQFTDKSGRHWEINESLNISEIEFRAPFD